MREKTIWEIQDKAQAKNFRRVLAGNRDTMNELVRKMKNEDENRESPQARRNRNERLRKQQDPDARNPGLPRRTRGKTAPAPAERMAEAGAGSLSFT